MTNHFIIHTSERHSAVLSYKWARACGLSRREAFTCACVRHAWTERIADRFYRDLSPMGQAVAKRV